MAMFCAGKYFSSGPMSRVSLSTWSTKCPKSGVTLPTHFDQVSAFPLWPCCTICTQTKSAEHSSRVSSFPEGICLSGDPEFRQLHSWELTRPSFQFRRASKSETGLPSFGKLEWFPSKCFLTILRNKFQFRSHRLILVRSWSICWLHLQSSATISFCKYWKT